MTRFRATQACLDGKKSVQIGWPNPAYDPKDPDSPKEISVVFGPKAEIGEVIEADVPDPYAKRFMKKTLEKPAMVEVVPTEKK